MLNASMTAKFIRRFEQLAKNSTEAQSEPPEVQISSSNSQCSEEEDQPIRNVEEGKIGKKSVASNIEEESNQGQSEEEDRKKNPEANNIGIPALAKILAIQREKKRIQNKGAKRGTQEQIKGTEELDDLKKIIEKQRNIVKENSKSNISLRSGSVKKTVSSKNINGIDSIPEESNRQKNSKLAEKLVTIMRNDKDQSQESQRSSIQEEEQGESYNVQKDTTLRRKKKQKRNHRLNLQGTYFEMKFKINLRKLASLGVKLHEDREENYDEKKTKSFEKKIDYQEADAKIINKKPKIKAQKQDRTEEFQAIKLKQRNFKRQRSIPNQSLAGPLFEELEKSKKLNNLQKKIEVTPIEKSKIIEIIDEYMFQNIPKLVEQISKYMKADQKDLNQLMEANGLGRPIPKKRSKPEDSEQAERNKIARIVDEIQLKALEMEKDGKMGQKKIVQELLKMVEKLGVSKQVKEKCMNGWIKLRQDKFSKQK